MYSSSDLREAHITCIPFNRSASLSASVLNDPDVGVLRPNNFVHIEIIVVNAELNLLSFNRVLLNLYPLGELYCLDGSLPYPLPKKRLEDPEVRESTILYPIGLKPEGASLSVELLTLSILIKDNRWNTEE